MSFDAFFRKDHLTGRDSEKFLDEQSRPVVYNRLSFSPRTGRVRNTQQIIWRQPDGDRSAETGFS